VGIHVPSVNVAGLAGGQAYGAFFREVEQLGLDAIWVEDRILHPAPLADALLLLTWAAAHTERLLLGTAVLVLNLRLAPVVARQVSTLGHLAGDRLALGVSLGGRPEEYQGLGIPMERRVTLFREGLEVLRRLLDGAPVDHDGAFFPLHEATVRPGAPVPLLIGGVADGAIRRAGELGDGWIMAPFGSLEDFGRGWSIARAAAAAAGKEPDSLIAGRLLYVAVDDDRARAREALGTFLHGYYGPGFDVDQHAIFGPAGEVAARLREQVDAGISHLMLGVPTLDHDHLRRLAEEVAPALRA
jgi:alkanesulfonate monooxygenase SsuD/methylene tetrahydromethanopterin reductase-like flavin-dependent oxidoreductase (luciferase family)